jgi:hypothetical protein
MFDKKVILGVAKDKEGVIIVDKVSKKGVRIPDEAVAQLTLIVWELCDKLECGDIVTKLIGDAPATPEQKGMLTTFVGESLDFFQKMGWAVKKEAPAKKEAQAKKPAPLAKKK